MPYDVFMISPINTGLQKDVKPWLIPDDAFARLNNAYIYRGRIRKRFGSLLMDSTVAVNVAQLFSRVRLNIGTTAAVTGNFNNGGFAVPGAIWKIGQMFSIGTTLFTVYQSGAMLTTGAATGTFNTATGMINITGNTENPLTAVYYYPAEPIMGLITYEAPVVNNDPVYAFDTQFAYSYTAGAGWTRLGAALWTGNNSDFFWGYNYRGTLAQDNYLFVTNNNTADQLKYWSGAAWGTFNPAYLAGANTIETALIITVFKNRMLLLNTKEVIGGAAVVDFVNRCRYSWVGDPLNIDAFREDIGGRGDHIDAPTKEAIISARLFRDRLVVFFERSTWELVSTGDDSEPFAWQRLNSELGVESTFSSVNFDKVVLGIGNVGIHACNGVYVSRIDEKIPEDVYNIHNGNDGIKRVHGIRDYSSEVVYWTFPSADNNPTYPTRVLVYNYLTGSWAYNDDSITTFGYFQAANDVTWASMIKQWQTVITPWTAGQLQSLNRQVVAGNQEGFVFIVSPGVTRNSPALQITNIAIGAGGVVTITCIDHNLQVEDYVLIENVAGTTGINDEIYVVDSISATQFTINDDTIAGVYTGRGTIARVSRIDILTKQYNFYLEKGLNCCIPRVDFGVSRTSEGEFSVDYFLSTGSLSMIDESIVNEYYTGDEAGIVQTFPYDLYPIEDTQDIVYHPLHLNAEGESIQLRIFLDDDQLTSIPITTSEFTLHSLTFYAYPTAHRL